MLESAWYVNWRASDAKTYLTEKVSFSLKKTVHKRLLPFTSAGTLCVHLIKTLPGWRHRLLLRHDGEGMFFVVSVVCLFCFLGNMTRLRIWNAGFSCDGTLLKLWVLATSDQKHKHLHFRASRTTAASHFPSTMKPAAFHPVTRHRKKTL